MSLTPEHIEAAAARCRENMGKPDQFIVSPQVWNSWIEVQHQIEVRERALRIWLLSLSPMERWFYDRWQDIRHWAFRWKYRLKALTYRRYQDEYDDY